MWSNAVLFTIFLFEMACFAALGLLIP